MIFNRQFPAWYAMANQAKVIINSNGLIVQNMISVPEQLNIFVQLFSLAVRILIRIKNGPLQ